MYHSLINQVETELSKKYKSKELNGRRWYRISQDLYCSVFSINNERFIGGEYASEEELERGYSEDGDLYCIDDFAGEEDLIREFVENEIQYQIDNEEQNGDGIS